MLITSILNILHILLVFFPIFLYAMRPKTIRGIFKYIVLISILTPVHWKLFDGECISTIISKKLGDFKETETTSSFSETYLKWLYKPIMAHIFNWEWNSDNLDKMVYVHWILNFILIWYYIFFIYCR